MTSFLIKRVPCEEMEIHRDSHGKTKAEIGTVRSEAKEHLGPPTAGRGKEGSSPTGFAKIMTLPTLRLQASSLRNCENKFSLF